MIFDLKQLAQDFVNAIVTNDVNRYASVFDKEVVLRLWRWDGGEIYRPLEQVTKRLISEWSEWPDPQLELFSILTDQNHIVIEFRIQATECNRYIEHNRCAVIAVNGSRIQSIDIYCSEPQPSARRNNWIAPTTLSTEELHRVLEAYQYIPDIRANVPAAISACCNLRFSRSGSGDSHPGSNGVIGCQWTEAEVDAKIEETINYHRQLNVGFQWHVGPYDKPSNLRERLEQRGLVLAGEQLMMVRVGLENLEIPANHHVKIEVLNESDAEAAETVLQIIGECFKWTTQQINERRANLLERLKNTVQSSENVYYLARLNGIAVASAHLSLQSGIAYLGGAATLPLYRGNRIYSSLLKQRLIDARDRGYHIAALHAEPMSRPVVQQYEFKEYGKYYVYGWMPMMDRNLIRTLVQHG